MNNEQRINIKFCVKLWKTLTKTNEMLKIVYKDKSLSRIQVFEWHQRFKEGGRMLNGGHMEKEIRKNHALRSQESNQCSLFSTIPKALSTKNLFNLVK